MEQNYAVPEKLKQVIHDGRCIAFVGAGFAGAAQLPTWHQLLLSLAQRPEVDEELRQYVMSRIQEKRADVYEEAAQMLHDALQRETLIKVLQEQLCGTSPSPAMQERIRLLEGIPFRAVLTTNFDDLLRGETPSADAYRKIMRVDAHHSLLTNYQRLRHDGRAVLKLHGDLSKPDSVVISRLDYRRRLYTQLDYLQFLRAIFLNYTILYLGFSFTDAYFNELRSEALAVLGSDPHEAAAYAIVNDVPSQTRRHFARHEGIEILNYETVNGSHEGFDRWLHAVYETTNPVVHFGNLLRGKRLLWVDPKKWSVEHLTDQFFMDAAKEAGTTACRTDHVSHAEEALERLKAPGDGKNYDLVISHWGHKQGDASTAERLLTGIRKHDIQVPVLIYSLRDHANERKPIALRLGAQGYYYTDEGLIRAIERIFTPGIEMG